MAKFVKGDVVVIPFPFSDLSQSKRRPALVLTTLEGDVMPSCARSRARTYLITTLFRLMMPTSGPDI